MKNRKLRLINDLRLDSINGGVETGYGEEEEVVST
jgi:hypothetical protein